MAGSSDLLRSLASTVRFVSGAVHEMAARLKAIEDRPLPIDGKDGRDGVDGKDGAPGNDGVDGKDGRDGVDGKDGAPGERGPSLSSEEIVSALLPEGQGKHSPLKQVVADYFAAFPPPPGPQGDRGERGLEGQKGQPGDRGQQGEPGLPGRDGRDGAAGLDGKDGLGIDDIVIEYDGERTFKFAFVQGERRKDCGSFTLPMMIYRGVWRDGEFKSGDVVTFGGSLFVALKDTATKPETLDCDWKLAAKRGRDGRDGKEGKPGAPGQKGDKGEPGPRGFAS